MVLPSAVKQKEGCAEMVLPILARVAAAGAAGYGMKKIDEEEKAHRKAREDRKAERSGKSGDPRSRGRRMPESYTEIDPVTGFDGPSRTLEDARDRARYRLQGEAKAAYAYKRGEPYSEQEIDLANTIYGNEKAKAERKNKEVKTAKEAVEGMKKGGVVKRSRGDGIAQRGKTKGRMC